jgi:DNA-binding NarL/FixJ family response regulator
VLVAEHAATRLGIRIAVGDQVDICAEARDAEQAIRAAKRLQPDICLVGRAISGGLHAVRGICRAAPNSAVVVLADTADGDDMLECIRAGAIGYAPGALDGERLLRIIRAVEANEAVIPRSMVIELLLELRASGGSGEPLTGREAQVFRLLRHGHTTAAIAERLEVAPVTVRRHISGVVRKLGVADRATLTASLSRWGA